MRSVVLLAAALLAAFAVLPTNAARHDPKPVRATALELVVMEAPNCIYCWIFRRDVLPAYQASPRSAAMPLRFLDVTSSGDLGLAGPIDIVPTFVVLHNNRELGRIPGYVGPENFYHAVNHILARYDLRDVPR